MILMLYCEWNLVQLINDNKLKVSSDAMLMDNMEGFVYDSTTNSI